MAFAGLGRGWYDTDIGCQGVGVPEMWLSLANGSVEDACGHLIVEPKERSGVRWKEAGVQAMDGPQVEHLSGEWGDFCRF